MSDRKTLTASEAQPLWTVAGLTAAAAATVTLVVSFGLEITDDQQNAILGFVAVAAPTVVAWWGNRKVTPDQRVVVAVDKDSGLDVARAASPLPTGTAVDVWRVSDADHDRREGREDYRI